MQARANRYMLPAAVLKTAEAGQVIVIPGRSIWPTPLVSGALFVLLALWLWTRGPTGILLSVLPLSLAVFSVSYYPLAARFVYDSQSRELIYSANYLVGLKRRIELRAPFDSLVRVSLRKTRFNLQRMAEVLLRDGSQIFLDFGPRLDEADEFVSYLTGQSVPAAAPMDGAGSPVLAAAATTPAPVPAAAALEPAAAAATRLTTQAAMARDLNSWSIWLLITGVAQMVAAHGFSAWGSVLILLAGAALVIREAAMFIVFAVVVGWAGLLNGLAGSGVWKLFALVQAFIVFLLVGQFRRYAAAELPLAGEAQQPAGRARRWFPWLALGLGGGSLLLYVATWVVTLAASVVFSLKVPFSLVNLFFILAENGAVLGVAVGLAAWLAAYPRRWAAVMGMLAGLLTLALHLGIVALGSARA